MPDYYWSLWTPVIGWDTFGASASPRSSKKKLATSPPSTTVVHGDQHDIIPICDIRVAITCGIRGWRNLGFYASSQQLEGGGRRVSVQMWRRRPPSVRHRPFEGPSLRKAVTALLRVSALYRDTVLLRPPYWRTPTLYLVLVFFVCFLASRCFFVSRSSVFCDDRLDSRKMCAYEIFILARPEYYCLVFSFCLFHTW